MRRTLSWITFFFAIGVAIGYGFILNPLSAICLLIFTLVLSLNFIYFMEGSYKLLIFTILGFLWILLYSYFSTANYQILEHKIASTNSPATIELKIIGANIDSKNTTTLFGQLVKCHGINVLGAKTIAVTLDENNNNKRDSHKKPYYFIGQVISINRQSIKPFAIWQSTHHKIYGTFNYPLYLRASGVLTSINVKLNDIKTTKKKVSIVMSPYFSLVRFLLNIKQNFFIKLPKNSAGGLISAMTLGDKKALSPSAINDFTVNGTGHILAVSGIHISILYGIFIAIKRRLNSSFISALFIVFMISYGILTAWSPSVTRAIGLMYIHMIAKRFALNFDFLSAISLLGLLAMLKNPYTLFSSSFLMSFLAVLSIVIIGPAFAQIMSKQIRYIHHKISILFKGRYRWFIRKYCNKSPIEDPLKNHGIDKLLPAVASTFAVQLGMLPFLTYCFFGFSFTSMLINIPVLIIAYCLLPLSICVLIMNVFFTSDFVHYLTLTFSHVLLYLNHRWAQVFSFYILTGAPPLWLLITVYISIMFLCSESFLIIKERIKKGPLQKTRLTPGILAVLLIFLSLYHLTKNPCKNEDLVFLGSKSGFALHIHHQNRDLLINGGGDHMVNDGKNLLFPYFAHRQITKIHDSFFSTESSGGYLGIFQLSAKMPTGTIHPIKKNREKNSFQKIYDDNVTIIHRLTLESHQATCKKENNVNQKEKNHLQCLFIMEHKNPKKRQKENFSTLGNQILRKKEKGTNGSAKNKDKLLLLGYIDGEMLYQCQDSIMEEGKISCVQTNWKLASLPIFSSLMKKVSAEKIIITNFPYDNSKKKQIENIKTSLHKVLPKSEVYFLEEGTYILP